MLCGPFKVTLAPSPDRVSNDCTVEGLHALPCEEVLFGAPDKPNCTRTARSTCCMSRAETLPILNAIQILIGRVITQNDRWTLFANFPTHRRIKVDPPDFTAQHR